MFFKDPSVILFHCVRYRFGSRSSFKIVRPFRSDQVVHVGAPRDAVLRPKVTENRGSGRRYKGRRGNHGIFRVGHF